jgi:hypothetical protein
MPPHKGKGLSNAVSISYGGRGLRRRMAATQTVLLNKTARQVALTKKAQQNHLAGMYLDVLRLLVDMQLTFL